MYLCFKYIYKEQERKHYPFIKKKYTITLYIFFFIKICLLCAKSQNRYTNMYLQIHKHHNKANHLEKSTEQMNENSNKLLGI